MHESFGLTDRGMRRHHNEDQVLLRDDLGLYVVADGMGGHAAGEVAADLAVREVERIIEATRNAGSDTWPEAWDPHRGLNTNRIVQAILSAHRRVTAAVDGDLGLRGMGATIVAALTDWNRDELTIAHVGDSRAYVLRNSKLEQLTADHSWVHEQVLAGLLTEEAARSHPLKNVVTRALGGAQEPMVDVSDFKLVPGDQFLMCSDGLNTMLSDDEILTVLNRGTDLARTVHQLVAEANRKGGLDNITIILTRTKA
jgi:PPM family protein phosphatase